MMIQQSKSQRSETTLPPPRPEVRHAVRDLLTESESFKRVPVETQRDIAHNMAQIAEYLAAPEGITADRLPNAPGTARIAGLARGLANDGGQFQQDVGEVHTISTTPFRAEAAREGAAVAGLMLQKVNFPRFVSGLIKGVFHAIVEASIEQMEAYGRLVASVAQTLNQFRDENVDDAQGQQHLMDQFPDVFQMGQGDASDPFGGGSGPQLRLRDGVDESAALSRVNARLPMDDGKPLESLDPSDDTTRQKLTDAARTQLATSRQQLLATMVLMGINRIVVTDGKIQAKILYDFQARDTRQRQRRATATDVARDPFGNVVQSSNIQQTWDSGPSADGSDGSDGSGDDSSSRQNASYYTKGTYQYAQQPIITAVSTASDTQDSALQTRASLAGTVDVNFKSDYFPLEKMADSFQIGRIQNAAQPGRGAAAAAGTGAAVPASGTAPAATPAAAPGAGTAAGTGGGSGAAAASPPPSR
jgi:hypothetical protein